MRSAASLLCLYIGVAVPCAGQDLIFADGFESGTTCSAWSLTVTPDLFDPALYDADCDGSDGTLADCVFVSAATGNPGGTGLPTDPLDTIGAGIVAAPALGKPSVCVSVGSYIEQVQIESGISVFGGFEEVPTWHRSLDATSEVLADVAVFTAEGITSRTRIEGLLIDASWGSTDGATTHGVHLVSGSDELIVRYNTIEVDFGRNGADGAAGLPFGSAAPSGNPGEPGCDGCLPGGQGGAQTVCAEFGGRGGDGGYDTGSGTDGSLGSANAIVGSGGPSSACFGGGNPGTRGGDGDEGIPGTAGDGGPSIGVIDTGSYAPAGGGAGGAGGGGTGGSGGGGGGGGEQNGVFCSADRGGGGASGGCGGEGGEAGEGGGGGGGSFGVFAAGGHIVVVGNTITASGGGNGGDGGDGAAGQLAGQGGEGGAGPDDSGPGGDGGNGGDGGCGGPGGGGGGGPSACLAVHSSVDSTYSDNDCTLGPAGSGGVAGTSPCPVSGIPGADGQSAAVLVID